jgi:hypothetical protein
MDGRAAGLVALEPPRAPGGSWWLGGFAVALALVGGLVVVPSALSPTRAHWSEWIAASSGLAAGAFVARAVLALEQRRASWIAPNAASRTPGVAALRVAPTAPDAPFPPTHP